MGMRLTLKFVDGRGYVGRMYWAGACFDGRDVERAKIGGASRKMQVRPGTVLLDTWWSDFALQDFQSEPYIPLPSNSSTARAPHYSSNSDPVLHITAPSSAILESPRPSVYTPVLCYATASFDVTTNPHMIYASN